MADIDVQTAQLIIQLARDDFYQLGDDAQNGGLLSDLEIALAAQEREFMQRWMDYGDAQFHPGARRGGSTDDSSRNTSTGSGIPGNLGNDEPRHATSAPVTGPNVSTSANRPPPSSHLRVAVQEPRAHDEEDSDSDLSPILSDIAVFSNDPLLALSNNPSRPAISLPSSSNSATRNPVSIHNRSNSGTTRGAPVQRPATLYDDEDVAGPSNSVQITNTLQSVESIPLTRPAPSPRPVSQSVEELSDDEASSTTSSVVELVTGPSTVVECYFCKEDCPISTTIYTSCYHRLCRTCITRQIEVCIQDETTYPPKCCGNKLQISELHLTDCNLHQQYELKVREYDTPVPSRVYCYRCSRFLDSKSLITTSYSSNTVLTRTTRHCNICSSWTCINCKRADHPGQPCQDTEEDKVFKLLTKQKGWQTCPNCKAIVERNGGCNHMTCKCTAQFCYHCATRWKQCAC